MTAKERAFLKYWEANRLREKKWGFMLLAGIPMGLLFSLPILIILFTGKFWYTRADMAANSMANPYLLVIAVFLITVFVAVFNKRYQWERKEQWYLELKARSDEEEPTDDAVQQ